MPCVFWQALGRVSAIVRPRQQSHVSVPVLCFRGAIAGSPAPQSTRGDGSVRVTRAVLKASADDATAQVCHPQILFVRIRQHFQYLRIHRLAESLRSIKRCVWPPSSDFLQLFLTRCKHQHAGRFAKGHASDVYRQHACRNQQIDLIACCNALRHFEQRLQRKPWDCEGVPEQSLRNPRSACGTVRPQIIIEKLYVPLKDPIDFLRRPNAIVKSGLRGVRFAWRTAPSPCLIALVPVLVVFGEPVEFLLRLPFLPTNRIVADHEEVRCVEHPHAPAVRTVVEQFYRWRLIEILQHMCIVFHLVDGGQFDPVAFELDRHPHLLAWISSAHVAATATDPACGVGGANLIDYRSGLI